MVQQILTSRGIFTGTTLETSAEWVCWCNQFGAHYVHNVVRCASEKDIQYVATPDNALAEVLQWKPAHFKMKARGVIPESEDMLGFIANDLITVSPECVGGSGLVDGYDEDNLRMPIT
jgi:hypothetical protein